ncbi:MAG: KH domain-containing protein [Actinomycetota bacterium]|nr:KH domain-containing protein [Actinomycetota bacterium]
MEELLEYLAKSLVDKPEEVRVTREARDDAVVLQLRVAAEDVGKVIGRQGRTARALRTVVRAGGAKTGERTLLEIVE